MEKNPEPTFTGQQAATAQTALRQALGVPPETFPLEDFVGMISDEIEQLRNTGHTFSQIAELIAKSIDVRVKPSALADCYATPGERGRHGR